MKSLLVFQAHHVVRPKLWNKYEFNKVSRNESHLSPVVSFHVRRLEHSPNRRGVLVEVWVLRVDVSKLDGYNVLHHRVGWL